MVGAVINALLLVIPIKLPCDGADEYVPTVAQYICGVKVTAVFRVPALTVVGGGAHFTGPTGFGLLRSKKTKISRK